MPRDYKETERHRRARARREYALGRPELNQPSTERVAAAGPTSMGVKPSDPETDRLVADFLAKKGLKK